jgi:hypothetical protein
MQNTYKVTVGKTRTVEIIYETWRCGEDITVVDLE